MKPSKQAMLSSLSDIYDVEVLRLEDLGGMPAKSDSPWTAAFDVILGLGDLGSTVDLFLRKNSWPPKWTTARGHPQYRGLVLEAERVSKERILDVGFGEYDVVYVSSGVQSEQLLDICNAMECKAHVIDAFGVDFVSQLEDAEEAAITKWMNFVGRYFKGESVCVCGEQSDEAQRICAFSASDFARR